LNPDGISTPFRRLIAQIVPGAQEKVFIRSIISRKPIALRPDRIADLLAIARRFFSYQLDGSSFAGWRNCRTSGEKSWQKRQDADPYFHDHYFSPTAPRFALVSRHPLSASEQSIQEKR
jgi:hypothetical protein